MCNRGGNDVNSIRVTTIIPCFNREAFICDAIESALGQDFEGQEIIVVDDGSTDSSREVCQGYGSRIRLLRQVNQGPSAARNAAIKVAQGEYVAFLDSDDIWRPNKLQRQVEAMDNRPDAAFVHSRADSTCVNVIDYAKTDGSWEECFRGATIYTPTVLARTNWVRQVGGFDERYWHWEDRHLWLRLLLLGKVIFLDEALVELRRGNGRLSRNVLGDDALCWRATSRELLVAARQTMCEAELVSCRRFYEAKVAEHICGAYWHERMDTVCKLGCRCLLFGPARGSAVKYLAAALLPRPLRVRLETALPHLRRRIPT